jgi:hypothetical protein
MHLHDWSVCAAVMKSGDIGLAETYIAGDWTTPDLRSLLQLFIATATRSRTWSTAAGGVRCCTG